METLQLDKERLLEKYKAADEAGKSLLEDLYGKEIFLPKVTDRIHVFDDILADNGKTREQFEAECAGLEDDEIAYREAKLIAKTYNLHQVPDYSNTEQRKFSPYWSMPDASGAGFAYGDFDRWHANSYVGARLDFLNREYMLDAVQKFLPIYERLYTIKTQ